MDKVTTIPWTRDTTPDRLKAVLKALNRTQVQLGSLMGVAPVTINRWMNGHNAPDRRCQAMLNKLEQNYVKP